MFISLFKDDDFCGYQGRKVRRFQQVRAYRNLNKIGLFSCVSREGEHKGKVIAHAAAFHLRNYDQPAFVVSCASQARARSKGVRNVHAWSCGKLIDIYAPVSDSELEEAGFEPLTYNPFIHSGFVKLSDSNTSLEQPLDMIVSGSFVWIKKCIL